MPAVKPSNSTSNPIRGIIGIPKIATNEGINEYTEFRYLLGTRSNVIRFLRIINKANSVPLMLIATVITPSIPSKLNEF